MGINKDIISVCALVPYPVDTTPGRRYRIEQWMPYLESEGISVELVPFVDERLMELLHKPGRRAAKAFANITRFLRRCADAIKTRRYDAVLIHRAASIGGPALLERLVASFGRPLIYDFDDAIFKLHTTEASRRFGWLKFPGKTATICRLASHVAVGKAWLADYARKFNSRVTIIPTSIDTSRYKSVKKNGSNGRVVVGWTGSSTSQTQPRGTTKPAVLYICYYNITEPLVQTQVVAYLRELAASGFEIHLLTFELRGLAADTRRRITDELAYQGIQWHSLRYHQRPSLPATLYDIALGTLAALRICKRYRIRLVHARSYVPAAMALILKRLLGCPFLFDVRGLLADEYRDAGRWAEDDLKYKLTKRMERVFFRCADAFVVLTKRILVELTSAASPLENREREIRVIPCCVDTDKFVISTEERDSYRRGRGWTNRRVLTYLGKLGTWYLAEEMARFFAVAREVMPDLFFQVLTQSGREPIERAMQANGIPALDYDIRFSPLEQVPLILAASDAGISFIRPCYSKLSSSPTKIGEYLAAGLPVVANTGIGDCDEMLEESRLGVILQEFSDSEYRQSAHALRMLIEEFGLHARCRAFVDRELSLTKVGGPRYVGVYERVMGCEALRLVDHNGLVTDTQKLG